jgi:cob(I)alamin adenosyltransferase
MTENTPSRQSRIPLIASIVVVIALAGTLGFTYLQSSSTIATDNNTMTSLRSSLVAANGTIVTLNSKIGALNSNISSLSNTISSDMSTISADQAKVSQLQSQIQTLNTQATQNQDTITSLQTQATQLQAMVLTLTAQVSSDQIQLSSLNAQLSELQAVALDGLFGATPNCPYGGTCTYALVGLYANYGTTTASSVSVTLTFYAGPSHSGQVLCSTTVLLGTVQGRSLHLMTGQSCSSTSSTQAQSLSWQFTNG